MVVGRTATNAPVSQLHYIACRDACWWATNAGPNTRIVVDNSLITTCNDGPAVSLNGSPTVSPVTAALCASLFLPPKLPSSMNFLALSCEGSAAACQQGRFAPPSKCDWQHRPQPRTLAHTQPLAGLRTHAPPTLSRNSAMRMPVTVDIIRKEHSTSAPNSGRSVR